MFTYMRRTKWIVFALATVAMGIGFLVYGTGVVRGLKNAADVKDLAVSSYEKGMWVKGTTDFVWDSYCSELKSENDEDSERYRWYLVWIDAPGFAESDEAKDCYLGVKVPKSEFENYEKLKKEGLQYELTFQGKLVPCSGEVLKLKKEFVTKVDQYSMEKNGTKVSQLCVLPDYYVELTTTRAGNGFIGVGIFCLVAGILLVVYFIYAIRKDSKYVSEASAQSMMSNGTTYGYGANGAASYANSGQPFGQSGTGTGNDPLQNASVGVSTGFYRQDDQDELSRLLAEEDQKVANYNFQTGLSGSNRVEDDR